jgi:hypothetical protein
MYRKVFGVDSNPPATARNPLHRRVAPWSWSSMKGKTARKIGQRTDREDDG